MLNPTNTALLLDTVRYYTHLSNSDPNILSVLSSLSVWLKYLVTAMFHHCWGILL